MLEGHLVDGRFEIEALAGRGGMGAVYRARDLSGDRLVAIKVMNDAGPADLQRFEREGRILRGIEHPHIVGFFGSGETSEGLPYLALEWLDGIDAEAALERDLPSCAQALQLARRVAHALGAAHAGGIVHRDIKPSNIFLVGGRWESAKVLDFGIARNVIATRVMTQTGTALGTPAYMAPEQARGERAVDARADVFSLGAVLFQLLTGRPPFIGQHPMAVLAKVLFEDAPRVSELNSEVPEALDALVARMLSKKAEARPAGGAEVARLLEAIVAPASSAARTALPSQRPVTLGHAEQRLLAVVICAPEGRSRVAHEDDVTVAAPAPTTPIQLDHVVEAFGARYSPLADGSSVAVLMAEGAATDLALRAARCALALRLVHPGPPMAMVVGRGVAASRAPVGEVIDRAVGLVEKKSEIAGGGIRIDDLAAGLLGERFEIRGDDAGLWLEHEREARVGAPRHLLGKSIPCVGRTKELAVIDASIAEALEESSASALVLTGEPGMGKSRLLSEVLRRVEADFPDVEIWIGHSDPIGAGATLGILASALRRASGIAHGEALAVRRQKWRARATRGVDDDETARNVVEFLGEVVGAAPEEPSLHFRAALAEPSLMGDQITRAFSDLVAAETQTHPVCLVLEDFQWGDAATLRVVEAALRQCRERRFFVLFAGRPEMLTQFPTLSRNTTVTVGALTKRAAGELVYAALGAEVSDAMRDELVTRAAGNPFFLEELARCASHQDGGALPETILAMLQARLEALPAEARRILRAASVLGTVFWSGAVARLLEGRSRTTEVHDWMPILLAEETIERRAASRFPSEDEFVFRHSLLRDAAYASFTEDNRLLAHRIAGEWLEANGERDPLVLAEHAERGGDAPRALTHLLRAAEQALFGQEVQAALSLLGRARKHEADATPILRGRLSLLEAEALRWVGDFNAAGERALEAAGLLEEGSSEWYQAMEEAFIASGRRSEYDLVIDWHLNVGAATCAPGAQGARVMALCTVGRLLFHAGGYELADQVIELVRDQVDSVADSDPRAAAEVERLLGARARHVGNLEGDLSHYRRALWHYEAAGDMRHACNARVSVGFAHVELGDHAAGRAHLEAALAEAERMGLDAVITRARQNLGLVLTITGDLDEARASLTQVADASAAQGNVRFEGWTRIYLARALMLAGELDDALLQAQRAASLLEATPPARAGALAILALVCAARGEPQRGIPHAREAEATLEAFGGIEEFESLVWLSAVRVALGVGDAPSARRCLTRAKSRLQARADALESEVMRASFLAQVPENLELMALRIDADEPSSGDTPQASAAVREAYSLPAFDRDAAHLLAVLHEHLASALPGQSAVAPPALAPEALLASVPEGFPQEPVDDLRERMKGLVDASIHQHHGRYMGYQVAAPVPRAALVSALAATLNSGMAAFDSGGIAAVLERRTTDWMLSLLGWPPTGGILTSGGSLGNLTALLAARQARAGWDVRAEGLAGRPRLGILCGAEAHYSVERAAQIMGLGRDAVIPVASDAAYRMDPGAVDVALAQARARGVQPFALVASAGATGTGAIDPLRALAARCREHGLWFHVDGAHGASALLSEKHRAALDGIEGADSLVWDAHKLMQMPALVTAVLFRDPRASFETFRQDATYLYDDPRPERWQDIGLRTIECTKPLLSLTLHTSLATLGTRFFADLVDHGYALARHLARRVAESPDFELACEPDSNIVCFRHVRAGAAADDDEWQRALRGKLREAGEFFLVTTTMGGRTWLRTSLMSPLTTAQDLDALLDALRASADQAVGQEP